MAKSVSHAFVAFYRTSALFGMWGRVPHWTRAGSNHSLSRRTEMLLPFYGESHSNNGWISNAHQDGLKQDSWPAECGKCQGLEAKVRSNLTAAGRTCPSHCSHWIAQQPPSVSLAQSGVSSQPGLQRRLRLPAVGWCPKWAQMSPPSWCKALF